MAPKKFDAADAAEHGHSHHDHDHDHEHPDHDHDHEHHHDHDMDQALDEALELDTQSRIFLEMRRQNLDLLRLAAEVAGGSGAHGPLKAADLKTTMRGIWEVFSEFYVWIDPEESDHGDDAEDDEE